MTNYPVSNMVVDVSPLNLHVWIHANAKLIDIPVRVIDFSIIERINRQWNMLTNIVGRKQRERNNFTSRLDKLFSLLSCNCDFINCAETNCQIEQCAMTSEPGRAYVGHLSPKEKDVRTIAAAILSLWNMELTKL